MRWLFRYVPLVLFVAVWQAAVDSGLLDRHFLPSFSETIGVLWELARSGEITWNLWVTTYRALGELVIGSLLGIVAHQRRTAGTVRSVPLRVAWSASKACFPFTTHSARACSPRSLCSLSAIQSSAPRMVARSLPVRLTSPAFTTRPPSSMRCRVRLRRSTCHLRMSCRDLAA